MPLLSMRIAPALDVKELLCVMVVPWIVILPAVMAEPNVVVPALAFWTSAPAFVVG